MIHHHNYENKDLQQVLNTFSHKQQVLNTFSHKQQVSFAFYCSNDVQHLSNNQRVIDCHLQIQRWLHGDEVDLNHVRTIALNIWRDSASASASAVDANASVYSVSAAAVYSAANSASYAANSAANSAYYAARAKSYNLYPNNEKQRTVAFKQFFQEYNQIAQNWLSHWTIPNFPKESDFPIFDFLQDYNLISYLLPKKDNFYYLNLNGFDLKHENETELLKIINTTHIKNILRRIINNAETS